MSAMAALARRSAWAHRASLVGTVLVLSLAGALLAVAGVLAESGVRAGHDPSDTDGGLLLALAGSFSGTVIVVVVVVVMATVTLSLRGRRREFALMRAIGATHSQLRHQISVEVVLVGLVSAPVGAVVGVLLAQLLNPMLREAGLTDAGGSLALTPLPVVGATVIVLPVAWLSARLASRETLRLAPSQAVSMSRVESRTIGSVRSGAAIALGVAGLLAAFSPMFVPGTVGGASAAMSAFLLVGAVALSGPALVSWAFDRTIWTSGRSGPAGRLAIGNIRGFSRRLTTVVVPLALALTAGTAQTTVDRTVTEAGIAQLDDGVQADLVASSRKSSSASTIDAIAALPGVNGTTVLSSEPAQVLTDPDMEGVLDALAWKSTSLLSLRAGSGGLLADLKVSDGSVADLARRDTIAVSNDATFGAGVGVGSTVRLRWPDGTTSSPTVVAVYDRGLGFGDYVAGEGGFTGHRADPATTSVLVGADPGSVDEVRAGLDNMGMDVQRPADYATSVIQSDAAERKLSVVLMLSLLAFVLLAATNALVMVTVRRRSEFVLYRQTGATRPQVLRMAIVEAGLTGGLAWVIGTLAVVPAIVGVSLGMLGPVVPPVDFTTYLTLSVIVLVTPVLAVVLTTTRLLGARQSNQLGR